MWVDVMSGVMVLRSGRKTTIFIESSRLRDRITRVIIIFRRIYEAPHGGTCIGHIGSVQVISRSLPQYACFRLERFIIVSITHGAKAHRHINYYTRRLPYSQKRVEIEWELPSDRGPRISRTEETQEKVHCHIDCHNTKRRLLKNCARAS